MVEEMQEKWRRGFEKVKELKEAAKEELKTD